ncbi:hypothetical protein [Moraxella lacunata]|uniref:hypothetical protein n=1 Tax=Moraxella lacunata TaxID=477 RepID=UPI001C6951AA|nr:hypothetical protein [Moraxella lacunata]
MAHQAPSSSPKTDEFGGVFWWVVVWALRVSVDDVMIDVSVSQLGAFIHLAKTGGHEPVRPCVGYLTADLVSAYCQLRKYSWTGAD